MQQQARRVLRVIVFWVIGVAVALGLAWLSQRNPIVSVIVGVLAVLMLLRTVLVLVRARSLRRTLGVVAGFAIGAGIAWGSATLLLPRQAVAEAAPNPSGLLADAADCAGCGAGDDLRGLGLAVAGDDLEVIVEAADAPPDRLWLWFAASPVHPLMLERDDDGWTATGDRHGAVAPDRLAVRTAATAVTITIAGAADIGPMAVVSGGGDRLPDVGNASPSPDGTVTGAAQEGELAVAVTEAVATVQAGYPALDPLQRELARTVLARQLVPGTTRYELELASNPGQHLTAHVAVRFPEFAQHVSIGQDDELLVAQSIYGLRDGLQVCTWFTDGSARCEAAGDLSAPVLSLVPLVEEPGAVVVEATDARVLAGETLRCLRITATVEGGPDLGETCSTSDGSLAVNSNDVTGVRLVLAERTDDVDDVAFQPPGDDDA